MRASPASADTSPATARHSLRHRLQVPVLHRLLSRHRRHRLRAHRRLLHLARHRLRHRLQLVDVCCGIGFAFLRLMMRWTRVLLLFAALPHSGCSAKQHSATEHHQHALRELHVVGPAFAAPILQAHFSGRVRLFSHVPGSKGSECACELSPAARLLLVHQPLAEAASALLNASSLDPTAPEAPALAIGRLIASSEHWAAAAAARYGSYVFSLNASQLLQPDALRELARRLDLHYHASPVRPNPPTLSLTPTQRSAIETLLAAPQKQWTCPKPAKCASVAPLLRGRDVCVAWFLWGDEGLWKARARFAMNTSIAHLKALNPHVHAMAFTDDPRKDGGWSAADEVVQIDKRHVVPAHARQWITRLYYLSRIDCHAVLALDATVETCDGGVIDKALDVADVKDVLFASNVDHDVFGNTPLRQGRLIVPHAFALLFSSQRSGPLFREWLYEMLAQKGLVGDDQAPLATVAAQLKEGRHHRLNENFTGAFKSMSRKRFGFFPRFTYRIDGAVTLWHSHDSAAQPVNRSFCDVMNGEGWSAALMAGKRLPPPPPRLVVQQNAKDVYHHVFTHEDCERELAKWVDGKEA